MPERHDFSIPHHMTDNHVEEDTVASLREQLDRMVFKESYLRGKLREADDKDSGSRGQGKRC